jgi:hypothetical protein
VFNGLIDFLKDAGAFTLIGAPAAVVRTIMRREFTVHSFLSNGASCAFVSPLAGWTAGYFFPPNDGHTQGIVYVIIGVSTLLGKDLIDGLLVIGDDFRKAPRETFQKWLGAWRNGLLGK